MNLILKLIICLIVGAWFALWVNLEYNKWKPKDEWKPVESKTLKDNLIKENWRKDYETTVQIEKDDIKILDWRNKK